MPSYSEPPTPLRDDYLYTSLETSSCDDIKNIQCYGKSEVLLSARYNCLRKKREEIARFLKNHADDDLSSHISSLRSFAKSNGGLILDQYRAQIWPVLAHRLVTSSEDDDVADCDAASFSSDSSSTLISSLTQKTMESEEEDVLRGHPEWHQVELDVHRTLARFPPNISDDRRSTLQCQLTPLIIRVLRTNPRFRYYQGFHDVCLTVLLVCGVETAFEVCRNLAHYGPFRAYLLKSLEESVLKELEFLYVILSRVDPHLERILREVRLGTMFALSWPLTWFSHALNEYQQIVRFFDVFLASPPLTPIYVSAAIVLERKSAILTCEREMPIIHQLLSTMPHELHLDAILSDSIYLASLMPPLTLRTEFTRIYKQRINARNLNREWGSVSRYAITMVAAVGIAGAAYYLNMGGRFSLSM